MFNFLKVKTIALALGLLFSASSFATVMTDTVSQNTFVGWWESVHYQHNLNDNGFVLGSAVSGSLQVAVSDDGGRFDLWEVILFTVEDFDFDTGAVTFNNGFSGDLEINALGQLNTDGYLDVTVTSLFGDFYLGDSTLTVSVPAPSTLLIFAIAVVGLVMRRQRDITV
jgi:hypothetical protein